MGEFVCEKSPVHGAPGTEYQESFSGKRFFISDTDTDIIIILEGTQSTEDTLLAGAEAPIESFRGKQISLSDAAKKDLVLVVF